MARKEYAGGAAPTTLISSITNISGSITVQDATNWPTGAIGPFWIRIGTGLANEEKIRCSSRSGNVLTVAGGGRGGDGTTAISHDPPEIVEHVFVAEDANEANQHIFDNTHDNHFQYLNNSRHANTGLHAVGTVVAAASAASDLSGISSSGGSSTDASRGNHSHAFPSWSAYTPTFTGLTPGNGTVNARALRVGKLGFISFNMIFGSSSSMTGILFVGLPTGWAAAGINLLPLVFSDGTGEIRVGSALAGGGDTRVGFFYTDGGVIGLNSPFPWGNNSTIRFSGAIELQ